MTAPVASLVQFFDFDNSAVRKDGLSAFGATTAVRGVQAWLATAPPLLQSHVAQSAIEALHMVLNVRVVDILAAAWNARRELKPYTDRAKFPPDQIIDHTLSKHDVRSTHRPRLQIMLDQSPIGPEIEFEVTVGLTIESAILKIRDGRIMNAHPGKAFGTGTIKCEGATLFSRPTKAVTLPLTISFGAGIPISRAKHSEAVSADAA